MDDTKRLEETSKWGFFSSFGAFDLHIPSRVSHVVVELFKKFLEAIVRDIVERNGNPSNCINSFFYLPVQLC
jgi:hypothetical protein